MSLYSCAIISHRPNRFKWKYKENNNGCKRLKKRVNEQIVALYERGVRRFLVGGGLRHRSVGGRDDIETERATGIRGH